MTSLTFTPAQFASYVARLGRGFYPAAVRGVRAGALRVIPLMQERTMTAPPASERGSVGAVNYGVYKASWKSEPLMNGVSVWNAQPYSGVIELGRRPSPVSKAGVENLAKWAQRKLRLSPSEAKSAAFAIARKLAKRPLKARRVMTGAIDQMSDLMLAEINHELESELSHK